MEGVLCETLPDLEALENKLGRKTPEGLLRWLREDPAQLLGDSSAETRRREPPLQGCQGLGEKIKALKLELAYLRAIDVRILQQLVAVNEGIEAVKWIMEEKGTLTSRCSSLTSSQYSLVESQETSRRGSWSSLQDPNERLDSISIGSYLDTLADDMDEYCHSTSESLMSSTPNRQEWDTIEKERTSSRMQGATNTKPEKVVMGHNFHRPDSLAQTSKDIKPMETTKVKKPDPPQTPIANGFLSKPTPCLEHGADTKLPAARKVGIVSPQAKPYKNGKVDFEKCNPNSGKLHLEYDAHWRWVQSQDDVTFL
ncbi:leucine rich adaptor protein 1 [Ambystoma mexicanum]|uniref:leucine rich adaptor protein 1 n=1 Tax=Ambystoma mexicanum TaxID=8296 RepID=UPI0037E721C0